MAKKNVNRMVCSKGTYGDCEVNHPVRTTTNNVPIDLNDFRIENGFKKAYILNKEGVKIYSTDGKLKIIGGKLYWLNLKQECLTIKDMQFNGKVWQKKNMKIAANPWTKLYNIMDDIYEYGDAVEDLFDSPTFNECKLKVKGIWFDNQGNVITDSSMKGVDAEEKQKRNRDYLKIKKHPLYAVRKQALLRAMGYFRLPAKIRDITRTISRSGWGELVKEEDVEEIIRTLKDVESVEDNKYVLKRGK